MGTQGGSRLQVVRRLPRRAADFYAVSDLDTARRLGGVLWIFGAVIAAVLLPLSPPTERIGAGGWAVGAAVVALCLASAVPLLRFPERVSPSVLLAMSYASLLLIALLQWLGGRESAYGELYIIPVIYCAMVHPPRRVGAFLLAVVAAMALPLAYEGWDADYAGRSVAELLLWAGLAAAAVLFSATVRVNRMDLRKEEEQARRQARRDPLTGLGNRLAFDEVLGGLAQGARHTDRPLALAILDIEGFKAVNDRHGHLEGDRVLCEVSAVLARTVRAPDACFRWGGDEFAILLPYTDRDRAEVVAGRVGQAVAAAVRLPEDHPLEVQYGIAEIRSDMSAGDLVAAADLELMAAKARRAREPQAEPAD
jgi:diguanylate cyclase (GGDEF)-like protein